jgi:U11/U12 small nuclear ribonucleoprotein SNRNP48
MERKAFLKDLSDFIAQTEDSLQSIAGKLGWNAKKLLEEQKVVCPYKSDHHVSPGSFQKHTERCRLKSLGIDPDVEASTKLESSSFGYKDSERVVTVIAGKHMYHLLSGNEVIN